MQKKLTPNTKSEQAGKLTESEEMRQLINMMCETGETMSTKNYRKMCSSNHDSLRAPRHKSISIFCLCKYYANFLWLYEEKRWLKRKSNKNVSKLKVKRIFMLSMFVLLSQHCLVHASANLIIENLHLTCFISISDGFANSTR